MTFTNVCVVSNHVNKSRYICHRHNIITINKYFIPTCSTYFSIYYKCNNNIILYYIKYKCRKT